MDPLSLVIGALIAVGGVAVGRLSTRNRLRAALEEERGRERARITEDGQRSVQPLCGCGHHLVFHDRESSKCQSQVVIPGHWTGSNETTYRQCMCQGYRGPRPIDPYYAPDLNEN
ncbi:hypothetical protein IDM40_13040 [Nocardiopsis sp. HNM0947]|uniref:Uncharacterized protein n=1 Tax=Nocardiopsis coralli TaxID=2772213 RepID=A0ABR9P731_9ACTN|nr:hypothetical protein [Nocardiopsis coralli]MBE2999626.1 hypothetical protein [Nocardiopsis coralli]